MRKFIKNTYLARFRPTTLYMFLLSIKHIKQVLNFISGFLDSILDIVRQDGGDSVISESIS